MGQVDNNGVDATAQGNEALAEEILRIALNYEVRFTKTPNW